MFKEVFCLEKIHGTSTHVSWDGKEVSFFSGGEGHEKFVKLFDKEFLKNKFIELFGEIPVTVYGEGYGGKQQGMSKTYGSELKFIAFEVRVGYTWLNVPNAFDVVTKLGLEFVDFVQVPAELEVLNFERDKPSVQAERNGCGNDKQREGIIIRPLEEVQLSNGQRIIAKHKQDSFRETATPREVNLEQLQVLKNAEAVANEWVTNMRLEHVLNKLPECNDFKDIPTVVKAMQEDIAIEGEGEIEFSKDVMKAIGKKTVDMFKSKITVL